MLHSVLRNMSLSKSFALFMLISMSLTMYLDSIGNKTLMLNLMIIEMPVFTYFLVAGYRKLIDYENHVFHKIDLDRGQE